MPSIGLEPRVSLHYLEYNPEAKTNILLLHGLGATGESWGYQIPALQKAGYHILAPDARGFGKSSYPGGGTSVSMMATDMLQLLEHLKIHTTNVVGISMGGALALQLALDHPERLKKLVLVNTFASMRPRQLNLWIYFLIRFLLVHTVGLPAQARAVAYRIFPNDHQKQLREELIQQIVQADPGGYRATMRALARFNVSKHLPQINTPTLVITGEHDSTVPVENQQSLVSGIPNARQVIIPGAGHAVSAEKPEIFNQTLLDFLNSSDS